MSILGRWRPHTTGILIGGVVLVLLAVGAAFIVSHAQPPTEVRLGSSVLQARVVKDEVGRQKGLSGVKSMKPNEALLMVFDTSDLWGIWMKDMEIPIDILWLDENGKVVHIVKNAPETDQETVYSPKEKARYVLELPAGTVQSYNFKVGQVAAFAIDGVQ
mgnify:CR=1 FL=1